MVLQKMRAGAQGIVAKVVVGLIVFVLAVTGFGAIQFFSGGEPIAATVNGEDITQRALEVETSRRRALMRSQLGGEVSDERLERLVDRRMVLESLVVNALIDQFARDLDLSVSDAAVQESIRESFAGVDGFDEAIYRNRLASFGHTPSSYQDEQAVRELRNQVSASFGETGFVTTRELSRIAQIIGQRRDIAYLMFDIESFAADVEVEEAEIEQHYGNSLDDYVSEEMFDFDFVRLPRGDLEAEAIVDEAEVELAYRDEIAAMPPPRRHAAHILLAVNDTRSVAEATALLREVRLAVEGGASFEDRARELSEDPDTAERGGDLGTVGKGIYPDAFEDVLWALSAGEMSEPVQTEFGVHLIKLIEIEDRQVPTLEQRREDIVAALRREKADRKFEELLREMDEIAFEEGDSLDGIAQRYGLEIEQLNRATRTSRYDILADAGVHQAAFGDEVIVEGFNSPAVATVDAAVVVRLRTRHPPTQKPLDEVRDEIRDKLTRERARQVIDDTAFDTLTSFADGATPSEIADATALEWQRADAVERNAQSVPNEILAVAFEMPAPSKGERGSDIATLPDGSRALVVLSSVILGDYGAMSESDRASLRRSLEQLVANQDFASVVRTLRAKASISTIDFDK